MEIITTTATIFLAVMGACCSPEGVCTTICATEPVGVTWELRYIENGPPVYGSPVAEGALPLGAEKCMTLSHIPRRAGNYEWVFNERGAPVDQDIRSGPCVIPELLPETGRSDVQFKSGFLALVLGLTMMIFGQVKMLCERKRRRERNVYGFHS